MATKNQIIFLLVWMSNLLSYIEGYRFEPNSLILNNTTECPDDDKNPVHLNISIVPVDRNRYLANGEAIFDENISGPLEVL